MKKLDVIVVGELNVDLILNGMESFPGLGTEIFARDMTLTLGSSSAIFANNLSKLGTEVAFVGKVGNDYFGEFIVDNSRSARVQTDGILQTETSQTGATIVMSYGEERANVIHPGAMETLTISDIPTALLHEARHLHFSSYFLQPGIQQDLKHLFEAAKKAGLTTSFDIQWDPLDKWDLTLSEILPYVDIFLPNEIEAIKSTQTVSLDEAIDVLRNFGTTTIIKMGNKGSLSITKESLLHLPAYVNNQTVDAIGAGDSFNAGFISKYLKNAPIEVCQDFGNLIGALSTTASGGTGAFSDPTGLKKIAEEKFSYDKDGFTD